MSKLTYTKLINHGSGRFNLMIDAKVKELIDYYQISSLFTFQHEWESWINTIPLRNTYSITNAFKLKINNGVGKIWKHYTGSDKDPVLIYEIREEATNV